MGIGQWLVAVGITIGELKEQSGHQSAAMLLRYAHGTMKNIAAKLA